MSADSPRRAGGPVPGSGARGGRPGVPGSGQLVIPQPVNDRSIIDCVAGFINEVVPQSYTSAMPGENKESVLWAHFESADINDHASVGDASTESPLPLLLVLGYATGVQVWSIAANGEASELISWTQGNIKIFRFLPSPAANSLRSPDSFSSKRPLVALCDSAGPGPPYCSVCFISLRCGDQIKSIKFKNQVCDIVANRRSVVVTFNERIAVFDACTLEDRLSVTTCYPSPGPNPNPVALGSRWLAYAERKLISWQRSSGGAAGVGSQSYTATVLHAAQTLGRGLRGLSETVASSLTGPRGGHAAGSVGGSPPMQNGTDHHSPGIATILDLEGPGRRSGVDENSLLADNVVSHFVAHTEAIVAMAFDPSGLLLLTADRRGHDFHVFRIHPHPGGSSLAAAHHLYVLHRGDTTAKVQDIAFSCDSRWAAVSTLRGTTHVFPLTPYGGPVGNRTHGSPHVVNRLSRFHRSAGLSADGRSSPVPSPEVLPSLPSGPHANPRMPPYPHPTVQAPLAQLRQPPHPAIAPSGAMTQDVTLRVCAAFAAPRAWLLDGARDGARDGATNRAATRRAVDSIFVMACHGNLVQYDLEPKPVSVVAREKVCDDTLIELDIEERAQWTLQRSPQGTEIAPPLSPGSLLLNNMAAVNSPNNPIAERSIETIEDRWLSQVEIVTHVGPHRRLWMGPQITFKVLAASGSTPVGIADCEIDTARGYVCRPGSPLSSRPARSEPVNMPASSRPVVPVLIESGSSSSYEQPPYLLNISGDLSDDVWVGPGESRLREDLADAMLESPGVPHREKGQRRYRLDGGGEDGLGNKKDADRGPVRRVVNPGGVELVMSSDGEEETASTASTASTPPDESTLRESVTTIAAAQLVRKAGKSPVSPVAVPLQQTEIIPVMTSPPRRAVISPPPRPAMTPPSRSVMTPPDRPVVSPPSRPVMSPPACLKEDPPVPVPRTEIAKMEVEVATPVEKEELPIAAPKRSWSSIVSLSAKSKSQKSKKNFPAEAEAEKTVEEERKGKKKGKNGKKESEKRRESPKKEEPEVYWEELQEKEYRCEVEPVAELEQVLPEVEDVVLVVPVEEELPDLEEYIPVHDFPELVNDERMMRLEEEMLQSLLFPEDGVLHGLLSPEEELEVAGLEEKMRGYFLRLASSEHESEEEAVASVMDELEEEQHYRKRCEDLALSAVDDTEYVEADEEVGYFCIRDRERVIDELEAYESFYHDAHKVVQEQAEEKPAEEEKPEKEVNVEEDSVDVVEYSPVVETLSTASADTSKRNRRQKKKRR